MQVPTALFTLLCVSIAMAAQPPELAEMAKQIVPKVRIANDAELFAAWNLDSPGLETVKARVEAEFYPDCVSKELCPGYHGGSRGAFGRLVQNARLMGYEAPEKLLKGLETGYDFYPKLLDHLRPPCG